MKIKIKKRGPGRPSLGDARLRIVGIGLTAAELARVDAEAAAASRTRSAFLRELVRSSLKIAR
jgi:hypothetical protein